MSFFINEQYFIIYGYHFSIQSSVDVYICCFQDLVIINCFAINIDTHTSLKLLGGNIPRWEIAGSCRISNCVSLRNLHTVLNNVCSSLYFQ